MATQSDVTLSPSQPSLGMDMPTEISVRCGSIEGVFHYDKLKTCHSGREGSTKCIFCSCDNKWVTPIEFENLGGRSKSGKWKQSIRTRSNVPIGVHLSSLSLDSHDVGKSSLNTSASSSETVSGASGSILVNPLLAFLKAFRLRGDTSRLKQVVSAHFDLASLINAHKFLWDSCGDLLKQYVLTFHARRSTDKRDAFEAILSDILSAFNKLDDEDNLPSFYCEAIHLLNLPCLVPDPVSKRLDTNHETLSCLVEKVDRIESGPFTSAQKALEQLVMSLKSELSAFSSSVISLSKTLSEKTGCSTTNQPSSHFTPTTVSKKATTSSSPSHVDRSANVILFGIPEISLTETKSLIDEVSNHLIGRSVKIKDAFRIGRKKPSDDESTRPRPLLIKLDSCWDRRILLSSRRNLKSFEKFKLFLREDLPPESRKTQSNRSARSSSPDKSTSHPSLSSNAESSASNQLD